MTWRACIVRELSGPYVRRRFAIGERGQVDATAEGAAGASHDNHSKMIDGGEIVDEGVQIERPLLVGAVEHVGPIQHDGRNRTVDLREHGFEVHVIPLRERGCQGSEVFHITAGLASLG
jgi:hypothetical protein